MVSVHRQRATRLVTLKHFGEGPPLAKTHTQQIGGRVALPRRAFCEGFVRHARPIGQPRLRAEQRRRGDNVETLP
ncbi:MAG: hypothetical protein AAFN13_11630 [Bacteroidota bacterium]